MGWIQKAESKLYPGYFEYGGSYLDASHKITVTEGRLFKVDNGYVLLAICSQITGIKDLVATETKLAVEIHEKEYERWLGRDVGNKKFSPTWYEIALVEWLNANPDALNKSFSGMFRFCPEPLSECDCRDLGGIEGWLIKHLTWFEPTSKIEFKAGSKAFGGAFKSTGQTEYQKLQDRTNWLYEQYASVAGIKREGDANLIMLSGLAASVHLVEREDAYQALQWNLLCQITGNVIPPPKPDQKA
ncbi:MAG TPA: hypothetical protein DCE56_06575 [Cyanobacteria bacterium UBA8553]|nr:hypothetical protein [Cyanobacteria bacterium UBA8553]HAJ59299.1 hypothetical protein [Cyanobacteria bacterium UBA8543]